MDKNFFWTATNVMAGRIVCGQTENMFGLAKHSYKIGWGYVKCSKGQKTILMNLSDGYSIVFDSEQLCADWLNKMGYVPMEKKLYFELMEFLSTNTRIFFE